MGQHKRFYDVDVLETDVGTNLKLPTQFEFGNGEIVKAQGDVESIEGSSSSPWFVGLWINLL